MKERKLTVLIDVFFRPNEELEKRIRATMKRPFRFAGSGQDLGSKPLRDMDFIAKVPRARLLGMRRMALTLRRWKGVHRVGFSVIEEIPLLKDRRRAAR